MRYKGRQIDPVALWEEYVEFPPNMVVDGMFTPKVQCPNPDHDTLKKHFQINVEEGLVHCFAHCGISGTFEHALCVVHGFYQEFKVEEAGDERSRRARVERARRKARKIIFKHRSTGAKFQRKRSAREVPRKQRAANDLPSLEFQSFLPQRGLEYLAERGVTSESVSAWGIGWDAERLRVVIPAKDERGITRFLIERATKPNDQPKYLYWPPQEESGWGKTDLLFGACALDLRMVRSSGMILVEGSIDTILNHQDGLRNTAGVLGTGISTKQVSIVSRLRPSRIYLMFDKDVAGIHSLEIAARRLRKFPLYVCRYPRGASDPAEMGKEAKFRSIERAVPLAKFRKSLNVNQRSRVGWDTFQFQGQQRQQGDVFGSQRSHEGRSQASVCISSSEAG